MKTLKDFKEKLQNNIDRAESDDWCVLNLNVKEADELLTLLERSENKRLREALEEIKGMGNVTNHDCIYYKIATEALEKTK